MAVETTCAVVDLQTGEQVNLIVAAPDDLPPAGCKLVLVPDGHYWNGVAVVPGGIEDGS